MEITNIEVENYAGARHFAAEIKSKVTLIAGHNGAGKSSIAEAIHHALTGEPSRVQLKKDFAGQLMHDGAKVGRVLIATNTGEHGVILPEGKVTGTPEWVAAYCTDPQRFAMLTASERRAFIFKLMGVEITPDAIATLLRQRGLDGAKAAEIRPHLASGFEAAHKEAQAKARDAKAAWRAITGETYGEKKAETWAAPKVEIDAGELETLKSECAEREAHNESLAQIIGAASSANKQHADLTAKLNGLKQQASQYARISDKLNRDEKELAEWKAKVEETRAKASGEVAKDPLACPHCGGSVLLERGALVEYIPPEAERDMEAAAKLPEYERALKVMENSVANGKRDLAAADEAARQIEAVEKELSGITAVDTEAISEELKDSKALLKVKRDTLDSRRALVRSNDEAVGKTSKAMQYHIDVLAWDAIAQALSPDGVPAEILTTALGDFNACLRARLGKWPAVKIDNDMNITVGGRLYGLLSESEQWRADAVIAATIAHISGFGFVMLDRFDVLDVRARGEAITWLGKFENVRALVLGTLKEMPAKLPAFMQAHWIEGGREAVLEAEA